MFQPSRKMDLDSFKFRDCLNTNFLVLVVAGVWIPDSVYNTWKVKLFYAYSFLVLGGGFFLYLTSEIIYIYTVRTELSKVVEVLFLLITHGGQVIKLVEFFRKRGPLRLLIEKMDDPMFNKKNPDHTAVKLRTIATVKRETRIFLSTAVSTVVLWAVVPLLNLANERTLPLKAWYPFDIKISPNFQLVYIHQITTVMIYANCNVGLDTLIMGLMEMIAGQLDILKIDLSCIRKKKMEVQDIDSVQTDVSEMSLTKSSERLKDCIRHHQAIMQYLAEQEVISASFALIQFVTGCVVVCITAFHLTQINFGFLFLSIILYQSCMLIEISLYCNHGNEVMLRSKEVLDAAYECGWYEEDKEFRLILSIMMERCKRPLSPKAGKIFPLSLATLISILRSSYSYFAVLRRINK